MSRDVLSELASGLATLGQIEAEYEAIMNSDRSADAPVLLGMSSIEWTAFGHGVGFDELARWRTEGWPLRCPICDKELRPPAEFGWLAQEQEDGTHRLVHIGCL